MPGTQYNLTLQLVGGRLRLLPGVPSEHDLRANSVDSFILGEDVALIWLVGC